MIDTHCHLTSARFRSDRDEVIRQASQRLEAIVISATHPNEAEFTLKLCEKYPSFIYPTLGLLPKFAPELKDSEIEEYLGFIKNNKAKVIAIGEIGLDYYWVKDPVKIGRMNEVYIEFLKLAKQLEKPVVLHMRESIDDGLKLIAGHKIANAVFHCFTGTREQADKIIEHGYYLSIATNLMRSKNLMNIVQEMPLEQMVTETDSPYLGPPKHRNVPQNVHLVIHKLAELQGIPLKKVDEITSGNARRFFNISE
jgi:TatD DNase family protein